VSTGGHLFILALTAVSLLFVVRMVRRNQMPSRYAMLWLSIGAVIAFLATFPRVLDRFSDWLGIAYGPGIFFLGAITVLFLIVVHFSWELARLDARTRVLAEELAILRADPPRDTSRTTPSAPEDQPVDH
jgi:putative solute:sodium symporter small subunit